MDGSLILVLGDQLTHSLSSLSAGDKNADRVLICEVHDEATYVRHHKKKIAFLFSAMRHFAEELGERGWQVDYVKLDDENNSGSFTGEIKRAIERHDPKTILVTEPGEYRLLEEFKGWDENFSRPVEILADDRFIASHNEFEIWAQDRKSLRMEYFYREMRKKTGLLMDGGEPEGGKWNYDHENRKPAGQDMFMPKPVQHRPDDMTKDVIKLVAARFDNHFGDLEPFHFAVTHNEAMRALDHFVEDCLPSFGDYQDAMLTGEPFLYHSLISFYINAGLLDPLFVCQKAEEAYRNNHAPLNAVEGFIRQIIGWREFIRGIYWMHMPDYESKNFFDADRDLPDFYWTGETDMLCLREAVTQTREHAYAHHIQRLMVTGNFAMLIGVEPRQIHEWYLIVYADAYEWVEMPNVIGMSQFADGGVFASKPYASSGSYINKMSDYCGNCSYSVSKKTGEGACPFNALYWDFLARNADKLKGNPRMGQMYATWNRMGEEKQEAYRDSAKTFLEELS